MLSRNLVAVSRHFETVSKLHTAVRNGVTVRCASTRLDVFYRNEQKAQSIQSRFQQSAALSTTQSSQHTREDHHSSHQRFWTYLASAGVSLATFLVWKKHANVSCEDNQGGEAPPTLPEIPSHAQYLLIGGGTATASAIKGIRSRDSKAQILIVTEEPFSPYKRPPLSKEFWYKDGESEKAISTESIFHNPSTFYCTPKDLPTKEDGAVACLSEKKVVKLDASGKKAFLNDGTEISYDKCLLATGGRPRSLPIFEKADEEVKKRTVLFRNIGDFQRLTELSDASKSVAVIGGGFLGSELACGLGHKGQSTGMKVYQVFPEPGNMGRVLPEYLSKWSSHFVEKEGVEVIPDQSVESVAFVDGQVQLTLTKGNTLLVDNVVVAVGLEPNTELAKTSGLETDRTLGGYLVNAELEARSNVWVAGDAACFFDIELGRRRVEHHVHAMMSGKLAGENMAGASKPYTHQSMFWSDLGPNLAYEAVGIIDSALDTTALFATQPGEQSEAGSESYGQGIILYKRDNIVVGVLLWNISNSVNEARKLIALDATDSDKLVAEAKKILFK